MFKINIRLKVQLLKVENRVITQHWSRANLQEVEELSPQSIEAAQESNQKPQCRSPIRQPRDQRTLQK